MLLGGKGGCQQCTCVPCDACTATCTNPHSGTAFETVYTRYFEGAEAGNPGDGYLTATGDSDTSDPYDGMDGNGPWYQQVSGGFTLNSSSTRYPCRVLVSFWRSNYTLGAATIPPPSSSLTSQQVFVEVTEGSVVVGDRVIQPSDGEVHISTVSIPLVSGGGDQSENDPRVYDGSIAVIPQCASAVFSVRARIEWNTMKRQHVLYGLVRECYEVSDPCGSSCGGTGAPSTVYVTISNFQMSSSATYYSSSIGGVNGTYAIDREPGLCDTWVGPEIATCGSGFAPGIGQAVGRAGSGFANDIYLRIRASYTSASGRLVCMDPLVLSVPPGTIPEVCGTGVIDSGTGATGQASLVLYSAGSGTWGPLVEVVSCTFDWELSA